MKKILIPLCSLLLALASVHLNAAPLGTAFTYQGRLTDGANPANGTYYLFFQLFDDLSGASLIGSQPTNTVTVANGLFSVDLDFGAAAFSGNARWLQINIRTNGGVGVDLAPRTRIAPTPGAIYASTAGTVTNGAIQSGQLGTAGQAPAAGQVLSYNGSSLVWANPAAANGAWGVGGNNAAGGNFLGTVNNLPLELRANNARALRLEPNLYGAPNVIGGAAVNFVSLFRMGATIAGGGATNANADNPDENVLPYTNSVTGNFGTVSGGAGNGSWVYGTVGGGYFNSSLGSYGTVGGGAINHSSGSYATVGGGSANTGSGYAATVAGGSQNLASADYGTVGGGTQNTASGNHSTISGGYQNWANGSFSFAAGRRAKAFNYGTFVWADAIDADFVDSGPDTFNVRAGGGAQFVTPLVTATGDVRVNGIERFGAQVRQMITLYDSGANSTFGIGVQGSTFYQRCGTGSGFAWYHGGVHSDAQNDPGAGGATLMTLNDHFLVVRGGGSEKAYIGGDGIGGEVHLGSMNPATTTVALYNQSAGHYMHLNMKSCTIFGGADLAEPFQMSTAEISKGAVVVIDDENAGKLKLSDQAYDHRVAGIVSGANGVNPGIALHQEGVVEGGQNVALSGRVYVQAEASSGPIKPGDLLTTSNTPGYAMKVTDPTKAQGAIIGKAMSALKEGKGMVLVLVSLQ